MFYSLEFYGHVVVTGAQQTISSIRFFLVRHPNQKSLAGPSTYLLHGI